MHSLLTNSGCFLSSAAFTWSNWEQYLLELFFQKELIIEDSLPIPPYTQHHLLWMKTSLWWFILLAPQSLPFHIIVQYPLSLPVTICFKNERFHYVSVEDGMQKYGQEGFFCLTYVEPKHQSNSHNQAGANDFQRLIWIF